MGWFTKCPKTINTFPNFVYFFLAITRLGNCIMTLTVKIWNEAFILISIPFFLTFYWLFGEFQNFLTHMKISWLFQFFLFFLTFSWPVGTLPIVCCVKVLETTMSRAMLNVEIPLVALISIWHQIVNTLEMSDPTTHTHKCRWVSPLLNP